jgi:hypothetical protein
MRYTHPVTPALPFFAQSGGMSTRMRDEKIADSGYKLAVKREGAAFSEVASAPVNNIRRLAFIDDLNIVAVRIKHPGRIIARIVFETSLRCCLALSSSC